MDRKREIHRASVAVYNLFKIHSVRLRDIHRPSVDRKRNGVTREQ